jgi:DNA-binding Lrp family transcriptional regulator
VSPEQETTLLELLQKGIPLTRKPFEDIAFTCNVSEKEIINYVAKLREEGIVRRFGAVFDTRRLGYKSILCAVSIPKEELDEYAAKVTPLIGVTHCYVREMYGTECPNLWFTLSYPQDIFTAMMDEVSSRLAPHKVYFLPATKRYKIDVIFGAAIRNREEKTDFNEPVTSRDRAIIRALQGDTELTSNYFEKIAEECGVSEWDVMSTLEMWLRSGRLKRIGLLLRHRQAGYHANGMCCWNVENGDTQEFGRALAEQGEVSHCYERPSIPGFPYNLYAMIHAKTLEEANSIFDKIQTSTGLSNGVILISTKEYKKTSMRFFEG